MPAPKVSLSSTIPKKRYEIAYFLDYLEKAVSNENTSIDESLKRDMECLINQEEPTTIDCKSILEKIYVNDYELFFRYHRGFKRIVSIGRYKSPRSEEERFLVIKAQVPEKTAKAFKAKVKLNKTDVTKFLNKAISEYLKK